LGQSRWRAREIRHRQVEAKSAARLAITPTPRPGSSEVAIQLFSRQSSRAKHCEQKAKECEQMAQHRANQPLRSLYLKIAQQWRERARDAEMLERNRPKS
jgi:hypothetical protein